jgi:hypothetical protein
MTDQSIIEQERKDFEKWYQSQYSKKIDFKRYAPNSFHYDNEDIQENYETWIGCLEYYRQASRQSSQSEPVAWRYRYHNEGSWQVSLNQTCEADLEWLKETYKELLIEPLYLAAPQQAIPAGMEFGENLMSNEKGEVFGLDTGRLVAKFSHEHESAAFVKTYNSQPASPTAPIESDK